MQIILKLDQKDFDGNRTVFDMMYSMSQAINRPMNDNINKEWVEKRAHIQREEQTVSEISEDKDIASIIETPETVKYTIEQIRAAFGDIAKSKGNAVAKGILSDMGYQKVTDIPPEEYDKAIEMIEAVK